MAAANYDILIEQGATFKLNLRWKDSEGQGIDLWGYEARMQIRKSSQAETVELELTSDGSDESITFGSDYGFINIEIDAARTTDLDIRRGVYDLELISPYGDVTRLIQGAVTVSPEVTK